jgi:hypothetical protein
MHTQLTPLPSRAIRIEGLVMEPSVFVPTPKKLQVLPPSWDL